LSMQIRMDGDFTNVPGGFPIVVAGQVVGAVAAGGARIDEDVIVAKAALAALELPERDDVDSPATGARGYSESLPECRTRTPNDPRRAPWPFRKRRASPGPGRRPSWRS